MPSITDPNTVKAIAREYCTNGRSKEKALKAVGYANSYAESGKGALLYGKDCVKLAISEYEARIEAKADVTQAEIIIKLRLYAGLDAGLEGIVIHTGDRLRALELLGKTQRMFIDRVETDAGQERELTDQEQAEAREYAAYRLRRGLVHSSDIASANVSPEQAEKAG